MSSRDVRVYSAGFLARKTKMHSVGDTTTCRKCGRAICVTEVMVRNGKYKCSACHSAASVAWARRNRDRKRAANNAYHSRISAKRANLSAAYRRKYPDRKAAHQAVQSAIRSGSMTRQPCRICGASRAHGHHDDYSKPLEVVWLCHRHHMEHHHMLAQRSKP